MYKFKAKFQGAHVHWMRCILVCNNPSFPPSSILILPSLPFFLIYAFRWCSLALAYIVFIEVLVKSKTMTMCFKKKVEGCKKQRNKQGIYNTWNQQIRDKLLMVIFIKHCQQSKVTLKGHEQWKFNYNSSWTQPLSPFPNLPCFLGAS